MKYKTIFIFLIFLNLIFCASAQKKIEKARENDPQFQYNMGLFYLNEGNINEAINHLNRAISLNPRHDLALNALGLAYKMKGDFEESVIYYTECLRINPALTEVHNNLGIAYQEMGFIEKAEKEFKTALSDSSYKSRHLSYYNLARLYVIKDKLQDALEYIDSSLEIDKGFRMAHNLKGVILEKLSRYREAIYSYKKALENLVDKDDVDTNFIKFNLAVAYFKNSELRKAKEIFEKIYPRVKDSEMKKKIDEYLKRIK